MATRRMLLKGSLLTLGMAALRTAAAEHLPHDVGRKFDAEGGVLPFAGNTVICHLPQQGEGSHLFDALLDVYRELPRQSWARCITALPPSSYHMTIFGCADDRDRHYPLWPAGLPLDMPMAQCSEILAQRLQQFRLGEDAAPYRLRVNPAAPAATETPLTLRLIAADAATETRLRRLRDRLADVTGIRDPDHDHYQFHITLGYQIAPLTDAQDSAWRDALAHWKTQIVQRVPVFTLGNPEFCVMKDMFAFKRQFYLT